MSIDQENIFIFLPFPILLSENNTQVRELDFIASFLYVEACFFVKIKCQ